MEGNRVIEARNAESASLLPGDSVCNTRRVSDRAVTSWTLPRRESSGSTE